MRLLLIVVILRLVGHIVDVLLFEIEYVLFDLVSRNHLGLSDWVLLFLLQVDL